MIPLACVRNESRYFAEFRNHFHFLQCSLSCLSPLLPISNFNLLTNLHIYLLTCNIRYMKIWDMSANTFTKHNTCEAQHICSTGKMCRVCQQHGSTHSNTAHPTKRCNSAQGLPASLLNSKQHCPLDRNANRMTHDSCDMNYCVSIRPSKQIRTEAH